jgi:putative membrane protein
MNKRLIKFGQFASLAVLILGTFVFAFDDAKSARSKETNAAANASPTSVQNANMQGNTNGNSNMSVNANMMKSMSADQKFMMMAAMGGMAEVQLGQLALQKTSNDQVRQFAQRMVDDHTKANNDLMQIAQSKGVTLPTTPDPKDASLMTRLQGLSGAEFDRVYIREAGVKDHERTAKLLEKETNKNNADADVKGWASRTLPTVQDHLRMARDLQNMMRGGSSNGNMSGSISNGRGRRNRNTNMNSNMGGNMNGGMSNSNNGNFK